MNELAAQIVDKQSTLREIASTGTKRRFNPCEQVSHLTTQCPGSSSREKDSASTAVCSGQT
ncbi:hypothetical protein M2244_003242 [Rhodoferax antarcticus]|nr:hypothetical protein [Rhodoferax antarcticus]